VRAATHRSWFKATGQPEELQPQETPLAALAWSGGAARAAGDLFLNKGSAEDPAGLHPTDSLAGGKRLKTQKGGLIRDPRR